MTLRILNAFLILTTVAQFGCSFAPDFSRLNRDPRCFYAGNVVHSNRNNNNQEIEVPTYSFDERVFYQVYNKLGQLIDYRDIYGTPLTNADLNAIGPYVSEVNKLYTHTALWEIKLREYREFPALFPKAKSPYQALKRPDFCEK